MRKSLLLLLFLSFLTKSYTQLAPDFSVTTTEGVTRSLYSDYLDQGKIVVLEFFFTTCPPCIQIAPSIQALNESLGNGLEDVVFIELSVMPFDQNNDIVAYENVNGLTYYGVGTDGGSTTAIEPYVNGVFGEFGGTPEFAVINPQGQVHFPVSGFNTTQTLANLNSFIQAEIALLPMPTASIFLETPSHIPIKHVDIYANENQIAADVNGVYTLAVPNIAANITPKKSFNPKNGVSTLDMLLITKHILGILPFNDNCKLAAADVNLSGSVTANDLLQIRRLILNIDTSFSTGQSWRFFLNDDIQHFGCDSFPFAPSEVLIGSAGNYVFEGVKYGDVNYNANPANLLESDIRNTNTLALDYTVHEEGTKIVYDFKIIDVKEVEGFQLALKFDPEEMAFIGNESQVLKDFNEYSIGMTNEAYGEILISWIDPYSSKIKKDDILFSLYFKKLKADVLKFIQQRDDLLPGEIYLPDQAFDIQLKNANPAWNNEKVNILQNPVHEMLSICINGIENTKMHCSIFNSQGKLVFISDFQVETFTNNVVDILVANLPSGSYYFLLDSASSGSLFSRFIKL